MASVMLIVAVSRGAKVPGYLADVGVIKALDPQVTTLLNSVSFWALITALSFAGGLITFYMIKGMMESRREEKEAGLKTVLS
jgi:hypothetical protein